MHATADCVPLVLASRDAQVVAAVHSGWQGTVGNIAARCVERLAIAGIAPEQLVAAIGPCIELRAFEVGEEVAEQFPDDCVDRSWAKPHVDLVYCVRSQLVAAGVPASAIERVGECTHDNPAKYFSYRRDGQPTGQQLSFVGWPSTVER